MITTLFFLAHALSPPLKLPACSFSLFISPPPLLLSSPLYSSSTLSPLLLSTPLLSSSSPLLLSPLPPLFLPVSETLFLSNRGSQGAVLQASALLPSPPLFFLLLLRPCTLLPSPPFSTFSATSFSATSRQTIKRDGGREGWRERDR